MATAVLHKPTSTWSATFPNEQVTETQSSLFVKKLIAVAVSNIAYLRAIFPESAFGDRSLEGLSLKILRDDVSCPGASQVIKWVKGCFDAFDKKYLRVMMIGLYEDPDDPDTVIESYSFKFTYYDDGGIDIYRNDEKIAGAHSSEETRKATIRMLRTIILLTQTLDSLPENVMMTMKLLYYDDETPEDYEPPEFKAAAHDSFKFDDEPMTIKLGDVATNYHSMKVRMKTECKQFDMDKSNEKVDNTQDAEVEGKQEKGDRVIGTGLDLEPNMDATNKSSSDEDMEMSQEENKPAIKKSEKDESVTADIPRELPAEPENAVDVIVSEASQATDAGEEYTVRCPCGCNEDDGLMVMCAVCKFWQHGICFLVLDEDEAPAEHICDICGKDKTPTDCQLKPLTPMERQATCLWRRTLMACVDIKRIVAPALAKRLGTEVTVAQGLVNRLDTEGFLIAPGKGKRLGKLVDKKKIVSEGIPKYMVKVKELPSEQADTQQTEQRETTAVENKEMEVQNDDEVDQLAEKTENLSVNNKKGKLSSKGKKHKEKRKEESRSPNEENKKQAERDMKRKTRKRAVSKRDEAQEFEISSTQEEFEAPPGKRKKASKVARDLIV